MNSEVTIKKIYVAGPITGIPNFAEPFAIAERNLKAKGFKVMNPALLGGGFTQDEYMHICYAMIDTCDSIYFLKGWEDSVGANKELAYARKRRLHIMFEED